MMVTRGSSCPGEGLGFSYGSDPLDEQMREFILLEITHGILERTPMIIGTIKEGITEILYERLGTFCTKIMAMVGEHSLIFLRVS